MNYNNKQTANPLNFGLAMLAGGGVVLMIIAGGVGVVQGAETSAGAIGVLFAGGLLLMIGGIVAWVVINQPYKHFDDINQPLDDGHGHAHASHDEHAIVPVEADAHGTSVTTTGH